MPGRRARDQRAGSAEGQGQADTMAQPENVGILAAEIYFPNTFVSVPTLVSPVPPPSGPPDPP